jgi:shikimate kinase
VGRELLQRTDVVLATGGGWPARPGRLDEIPPDSLTVWLRVDLDTALARAARQAGTRPLLGAAADDDAQSDLPALLRARETWYGRAHLHLDASQMSPGELADAIAGHLHDRRRLGAL